MTDKGGVLCTLPSYSSDQNLTESIISMGIAENGDIKGSMKFVEHVHGFGNAHTIMKSNNRDDHVKYINHYLKYPTLSIGQISTSEHLSDLPSCALEADFTAKNYVTQTGQRVFIPLMPLKKDYYNIFKAKERQHDIVYGYAYSEIDSIIINLPENFVIESIPKETSLSTPYGSLDTKVEKVDENKIRYWQKINIYEGRYDKSKYEDIKKFYQQIVTANRGRIVAKKE